MVSQEPPAAATAAFLAASRSRPPFELEPNVGQAAPGIRFLGRSEGMTLLFQADRVDLVAEGGRVRLRFVDAEPALEPAPCEPTGGRSHYFQGDDPDHWRVGIPRFAALRYSGVYPGIDAVFRDNGSTTEYDFFVAPGADPRAIRLILEGADEVSLEPSGDVVVLAGRQRIVQRAPVIFQQDGLGRLAVEGGWELRDDGTLGFRIGAYDPARTLVIDPVVDFSTYIGGSASDGVQGIAVDGEGYIFLTGNTLSVNFPLQDPFDGTLSGLSDAFIAKLDPSGQRLIFSTYFGGTSTDDGREIALGPGGDVHVAGATASTDFPTVTAFQNSFGGNQDAFVARFDPTGAVLERSSYLGGSGGDGPGGLSVDGSGGVFVSGLVQSSDFPVTLGAFQPAYGGSGDVFVTKVNASGSLAYSSYLGGSDFDTGGANAIDSSGNVYVAGATESADFPVMNGLDDTFSGGSRDGFVAKISPPGAELLWSTFLGGSGYDGALGVDLDQSRNVYVTGLSSSGLPRRRRPRFDARRDLRWVRNQARSDWNEHPLLPVPGRQRRGQRYRHRRRSVRRTGSRGGQHVLRGLPSGRGGTAGERGGAGQFRPQAVVSRGDRLVDLPRRRWQRVESRGGDRSRRRGPGRRRDLLVRLPARAGARLGPQRPFRRLPRQARRPVPPVRRHPARSRRGRLGRVNGVAAGGEGGRPGDNSPRRTRRQR
jgi:hypothetical protein